MAEELIFRIDIEGNENTLTKLAKVQGQLALVAKEQSQLTAELKKGKIGLDEYAKATAGLDARKRELKQSGDELNKSIKQQEQAFKGAEGSMIRIANELNVLKDRYRNLSQAERENEQVGGKLLTQIQAKDTQIKQLDATIGNHQRNVGNYTSHWAGLTGQLGQSIPIFGKVMNTMQGVGNTMNSVTSATGSTSKGMMALGGAIGIGIAALGGLVKVAGDVIASSDDMGDKWAEVTTGMQFAYGQFLRALATGDFSNFISKMQEAIEVGRKYAQTLDELENRTRSLSVRESETTLEVDKLRVALKNVNLTAEERKKISAEIVELERKVAAEKKTNAQIDLNNEMMALKMQTGLGEATIRRYIREYSANSDLIQKAQEYLKLQEDLTALQTSGVRGEAVQQEMKRMAEAIKGTAGEVKAYSTVVAAMGKADAEQVQKATDKWVSLNNVTHEYNQSVEKIINIGNRMEKEITDTAVKVTEERKKAQKEEEDNLTKQLQGAAKRGEEEGKLWEAAMKEQEVLAAKAEKLKVDLGIASQQELLRIAMERVTKSKEFELLSEKEKAAAVQVIYKQALIQSAKAIPETIEEWSPDNLPATGDPTPTMGDLAWSKGQTNISDKIIGSMLEGVGVTGSDEQMAQYVGAVKGQISNLVSDVTNMWVDGQQQRIKQELKAETAKVDQQTKKELTALEQKRKKGLITENQYNAEKQRIEENAAAKKEQLNKEAFEKEKKLKIITAVMAGALAVVQMLANPGGIAGIVLAALAAITAGIQIAKIASAKYEGARGGLLVGPSHAEGGIKYDYGGSIVELEGGEGVINKRSLASRDVLSLTGTPIQIASDLNSYKGYGVKFAAGGYTPVSTIRNQTATVQRKSVEDIVDERIQAMKVYVVESEITETQGRVKKIEAEASW